MEEIGLFPLPLVLLPSERVPLHIFEERYRDLIGECLAEARPFGLVYADDEGIRDVGTQANVIQVLNRFDDGRLNVLVEGSERFRLVELTDGRTFETGMTSPMEDDDDPADAGSIERALELFGELRELTGSDVEVPAATSAQLSYALAARVELATQVKLELLAERSERTRLEKVCDLLVDATDVVERQQRAAERAATNGKVDLS
jgi:ATP-dependent Lon protease